VPLSVPYVSTPDLLQWTSDAVSTVFTLDFVNYEQELKSYTPYFTPDGWQKFLAQVNIFANFNTIQNQKLFLISGLAGAPYIIKQGLLQGVYGWWIQMPIKLSYSSAGGGNTQQLTVQALVVRVPTLNNLRGVAIENMIVTKAAADNIGNPNG
jgi:intracellular multiplication protein IcmL